jgi:hypothetical protein
MSMAAHLHTLSPGDLAGIRPGSRRPVRAAQAASGGQGQVSEARTQRMREEAGIVPAPAPAGPAVIDGRAGQSAARHAPKMGGAVHTKQATMYIMSNYVRRRLLRGRTCCRDKVGLPTVPAQPANGNKHGGMRRPPGHGRPLLYLDFDGVLHPADVWWNSRLGPHIRSPEGHTIFEHSHLLAEALRAVPDVRIVLSTSWVWRYGLAKTTKDLPPELRSRVIGATWNPQVFS